MVTKATLGELIISFLRVHTKIIKSEKKHKTHKKKKNNR